jgi:hypothetical protein
MQLDEIKGISRRLKNQLCSPSSFTRSSHRYRNLTGLWSVAQCTGLRVENFPALEYWDIDFENLSLKVV